MYWYFVYLVIEYGLQHGLFQIKIELLEDSFYEPLLNTFRMNVNYTIAVNG